jgi:hypothetical protein
LIAILHLDPGDGEQQHRQSGATDASPGRSVPADAERRSNEARREPDWLWTGEVDRLFAAALQALRGEAERAVAALEQRRLAELTELSAAIKKQHDVVESLRREIAELRDRESRSVSEAKRECQQAEAERVRAARLDWDAERERLKGEADRHRSVAEQLADQLAASRANEAATERRCMERLKEITTEVDRCLLRARAEWVNEVARLAGEGERRLPSFLTTLPPES